MKISFKHIVVRSRNLFIETGKTWDTIASEQTTVKDVRNTYVFPWIFVCTTIVFLTNLLYDSERNVEIAFLKALVAGLSLLAGYFVAAGACFWVLTKKIGNKSKETCELLVAYSFTTIFALEILTSLIPSLFFLQILVVHCAWLLWEGSRVVLKLNEKEQEAVILFLSVILIFSPIIIEMILKFMLPNV